MAHEDVLLVVMAALVAARCSTAIKVTHYRGCASPDEQSYNRHCDVTSAFLTQFNEDGEDVTNFNEDEKDVEGAYEIVRGSKIYLSFDFFAHRSSTSPKFQAYYSNLALDIALLSKDEDACDHTSCPIQQDKAGRFNYSVFYPIIVPKGRFDLKLRLFDATNIDCCLILQTNTVDRDELTAPKRNSTSWDREESTTEETHRTTEQSKKVSFSGGHKLFTISRLFLALIIALVI